MTVSYKFRGAAEHLRTWTALLAFVVMTASSENSPFSRGKRRKEINEAVEQRSLVHGRNHTGSVDEIFFPMEITKNKVAFVLGPYKSDSYYCSICGWC